jgi:hypothetical protein
LIGGNSPRGTGRSLWETDRDAGNRTRRGGTGWCRGASGAGGGEGAAEKQTDHQRSEAGEEEDSPSRPRAH